MINFELLTKMEEQVSSNCQPSRVSVPWIIKTGRPYALPGCQDTSILPELPEGKIDCGECNQYYFYGCRKCLPVLLLDVLVPDCRAKIVYIPDIGSIKPQKSDMFAENPNYHGEVTEFYANYLRRMNKASPLTAGATKMPGKSFWLRKGHLTQQNMKEAKISKSTGWFSLIPPWLL